MKTRDVILFFICCSNSHDLLRWDNRKQHHVLGESSLPESHLGEEGLQSEGEEDGS